MHINLKQVEVHSFFCEKICKILTLGKNNPYLIWQYVNRMHLVVNAIHSKCTKSGIELTQQIKRSTGGERK